METNIIALNTMYLMALSEAAKSLKLDAVLQDLGQEKGRLWLVAQGSTVPHASIAFQFEQDSVLLGVKTRNERELVRTVNYAEGLDGFLEEFVKLMQAGHLVAPSKVRRVS